MRWNVLGLRPDGHTGLNFKSFDECWAKFGKDWGNRIRGLGDNYEQIIASLLMDNRKAGPDAPDHRGPYNSEDENNNGQGVDWAKGVRDMLPGVIARFPLWMHFRSRVVHA